MSRLAIVITLWSLASLGAVARADDPRAARKHFDAGSTLYDLGKFREAAAEYEEAYKAKSDPTLLFNIGQAYRGANQYQPAITAYKSYLRHVPDARNRADVEGFIARLQKQLDAEQARQQQQQQQQQMQTQTTAPLIVAQTPVEPPAARDKPPLYKRWWLWTAVGGAVVVGAVAIGVAFAVPKDAPAPANAMTVSF